MRTTRASTTKIDAVLQRWSTFHQHPVNRTVQWLAIPLVLFGILGAVWAIPFPHLDFLGKYNGFVNWASFLIAFCVYYYYRTSPVLTYGVLLVVFAFSAGIVTLEKLQLQQSWPQQGVICLGLLLLGLAIQFFGYSKESPKPVLAQYFDLLLNSPLGWMYWLFSTLRLNVR